MILLTGMLVAAGQDYTPNFESLSNQLVWFNSTNVTKLTIGNSRLVNINMSSDSSVLFFVDTNQVVVDNLVTSGCACAAVLTFFNYNAALSGSLVQLQGSKFGSAPAGGIYITNHSLSVRDTVFDSLSGIGAIYHNNMDGSKLEVTSSNFTNLQGSSGSAISLTRADMVVSQSHFDFCSGESVVSINAQSSLVGQGYVNETVTIDGCSFVNNSATQSVVDMTGFEGELQQVMHVYNSNFTGNTANQMGGAVNLFSVRNVTVQGCRFEQNAAQTGLGALYVYGSLAQVTLLIVRDSFFLANNGTSLSQPDVHSVALTEAVECGGLYASYCQCVGVVDSTFGNNTGTGLSGHGHGSTFGQCGQSDAVLFNQSTIVDASDLTSFSGFLGGGQYNDTDMGLDIRKSRFTNNSAVSADTSQASTEYSTGGAGLDILDVELSAVSSCTFDLNVGRQGAGLSLDTCTASIVWNCSFTGNVALQQGGAIAFVNSHSIGLLVTYSNLYNNLASNGGAIYGDAGATIVISNGTQVQANDATGNGGGVSCDSCQSLKVQSSSDISNNLANTGGACYCNDCAVFEADDSSFWYNRYAARNMTLDA